MYVHVCRPKRTSLIGLNSLPFLPKREYETQSIIFASKLLANASSKTGAGPTFIRKKTKMRKIVPGTDFKAVSVLAERIRMKKEDPAPLSLQNQKGKTGMN